MNPQNIKTLLSDCNQAHVDNYIEYLLKLQSEKKKDGQNWVTKNPWMNHKTDDYLATIFRNVAQDGLVFDGDDITLQSTGVSYSYQAFKNKMFNAYPESVIDVNLVYKDDIFSSSKNSGHVKYSHEISNPFSRSEKDIVGGYCVIKNKRGEFLTLLSRDDIDKHRKVAKTDYIWQKWFSEMALKTVIKKACKQHFKDIYQNIETIDNENYDLENLTPPEERFAQEEQEYLNEMKWYAVHEPKAYAEVLSYWDIDSARAIKKQSSWAGILGNIKSEVNGVQWKNQKQKGLTAKQQEKIQPFLNKMKSFAINHGEIYRAALAGRKVKSAMDIQNPQIQEEIVKEITLHITPEWQKWEDAKANRPDLADQLEEPKTTAECLSLVKKIGELADMEAA